MARQTTSWFEVDKNGLAKLLARRGPEFVVYELVQNALDEDVRRVDVALSPIAGRPQAKLVVEDDHPQGFARLEHAFTLFAESAKKVDPTRRGRYNLGEKLVLALCDEAQIATTTGTVVFDASGRRRLRARRPAGSRFEGILRMTREELEQVLRAVPGLIPPEGVTLTFNGEEIPPRCPLASFDAFLETEVAGENGILRRRQRTTTVRVLEVREGEHAAVYEMGIPVVETGDQWHYDVGQKVPLNLDRDNVTPAFLQALRTAVFNVMHERTKDCTQPWVRAAIEDKRVEPEAVRTAVTRRFGDRALAYDPSDPESNKRATAEGYTLVHGGHLSPAEWDNVRAAEALRPAGQVTPSPKPFHPDGTPLQLVPREEWTRAMQAVERYARRAAKATVRVSVAVRYALDPQWPFAAVYGDGNLTFNLGRLGKDWCDRQAPQDPDDVDVGRELDEILIHELAHHYCADHLSSAYHDALCSIGAALKAWARGKVASPRGPDAAE